MEQKQKIKQSREGLLQNALEAAQIGLWHWDTQNEKVIINEAWAKIVGYSVKDLSPFSLTYWFTICHPDDREAVSENLNRFIESKNKHFSFRSRLRHKKGYWVWTLVNGGVAESDSFGNPLALSGTITDISESNEKPDNHLHYRYEIEKLVAGISSDFVGIQVRETDDVINQTLKKIGQFMKVDRCYIFQFKNHNSFMSNTHEWCDHGIAPEMENLQDLPTSVFPWWMKKLNKLEHINIKQVKKMPAYAAAEKEVLESQSIISLLVVPIHYQKNLLGFIGFDSVIEEKEWMEADIHLMKTVADTIASAFNAQIHQEALLLAKEKAEESEQIKSAFLATINHELRTPLHHIMGFSELLRMNKIPADQVSNFADKIYKSGKSLLQIIEDILSLALADESFVQIRKEYFKGTDLFLQHKTLLDEMLKSSEKSDRIKLIYTPSTEFISGQYIADSSKINQIIVNMLKNAIKFTNAGSIEYRVDINKDELVFKIKDSGIGIPEHQQQLIFDFFRQADDSSTRIYSGIGVGLAISKRITKILNGELSVQSIPGKGSTFILRIPVETAPNLRKETQRIHS